MAAPKKTTAGKIPQKVRMLNGQKVTSTLYDGQFGKYMAAVVNDQLLRSESGRPVEWKNAGTLEWV